ncbi:MAG: hypothetical protein PGN11_03445 [Quadrisphaera sp.]
MTAATSAARQRAARRPWPASRRWRRCPATTDPTSAARPSSAATSAHSGTCTGDEVSGDLTTTAPLFAVVEVGVVLGVPAPAWPSELLDVLGLLGLAAAVDEDDDEGGVAPGVADAGGGVDDGVAVAPGAALAARA